MEENENKAPIGVYVTLIITIIILGIGYYFWTRPSGVESTTTENYSTLTSQVTNEPLTATVKNNAHMITIETNKGTIVFETYDLDAPKAAKNFVDLANKGFYNGTIFHRVIPGFMIQGGDPTGTGMGGSGSEFEDELNPNTPSYKEGYKRGVVAMANSGVNTNSSQFFIMHADYALPHAYTIFGKVVKGIEVVDAIASSKTGAQDRPVDKIIMKKVTAVENK